MLEGMSERRVMEMNAESRRPWNDGTPATHDRGSAGETGIGAERVKTSGGGMRILCFFALIAVLAVLLNGLVNHGLRRIRTSKFGALNRVMSGEVNADVVINGSSRALDHYDPRVIQAVTGHRAYNIGMNASQTDFQLTVLKAYLDHNTKPRLVIQNLDLFSFVTTKRGEIYDPGYYMPYLWDKGMYDGLRQIDPAVWKWKHIPLYGYAVEDMRFTWLAGVLGFFGFNPREDYFEGFNPQYREWTADFDRFKKDRTAGVTYPIEEQGARDLAAIAGLCRERGVRIVFVYSPEFHEVQDLERNRGEIFGKFREIAGEYHVPLWDYSDAPMCLEQRYFYNSQHLNAEGAEVFSADLARRLRELNLEGM